MILTIIFLLFLTIIYIFVTKRKQKVSWLAVCRIFGHSIAFSIFVFEILTHSNDYTKAIDPVDEGYTPFAATHIPTLLVFFLLYLVSKYAIRYYKNTLPPLTWLLANSMLCIGIVINAIIIAQTSKNTLDLNYDLFFDTDSGFKFTGFILYPFVTSVSSIYLIAESFHNVSTRFQAYQYQNRFLQKLHSLLLKIKSYPFVVFIIIFPVFVIVTAILMLFGQDYNSMVKVFTDTTTWRFSQQSHPPFLNHNGHYLCTVAAKGNPKIVKPLRLGKRHGHIIIVNRQLMIANAFEELIQKKFPKIHAIIRKLYDEYGYNLSVKINTSIKSNITYIFMKPLEWFFLTVLYLCCQKPEVWIKRQYL